jgi:autotransporter-associated beta strand protein
MTTRTRNNRSRPPYRPQLEALEVRLTPATHIWTGGDFLHHNLKWSDPLNWSGGVPTTGESGGTVVQVGSFLNPQSTDDIPGLVIDELEFTGGGNTIYGASGVTLGLNTLSTDGVGGVNPYTILSDGGNNTIAASLPMSLVGNTSNDVVVRIESGQLTIGSAISGDSNRGLEMGEVTADTGTLELTGSNTYTGPTMSMVGTLLLDSASGAAVPGSLQVEGLVQLGQDHQLNPSAPVSTLEGGELNLNGHNDAIGSLRMEYDGFSTELTTGGGTLTLNGDVQIYAAAGANPIIPIIGNLNLGAATRTVTVSRGELDIDGVISGGTGAGLTLTGGGVLKLAGSTANSYTGTTTVDGGTLVLNTSGAVAILGALVIGDGTGGKNAAVVNVLSPNPIATNSAVTINSDGNLTLTSSPAVGAVAAIGSLTMTGGGITLATTGSVSAALQLDGNVTATSDKAGNAATIAVTGANRGYLYLVGAQNFTVNSGPGAIQLDVSAVLDHGFDKLGDGIMRLSGTGSNFYTDTTIVDAGTLLLDNSGGVSIPANLVIDHALVRLLQPNQIAPTATVQIQNAGSLDFNGQAQTIGQLNLSANSFGYSQASTADAAGVHTSYTFTLDGATTQTSANTVLSKPVAVTAAGASSTASLTTSDTYTGTDGQTHETQEEVILGAGAGQLYRVDAQGNGTLLMQLSGFATEDAAMGHTDSGLLTGTPGVPNVFVSAGSYAYMMSGSAFYGISGANNVYGFAANAGDYAYHYDGSGASALVMSGTAYSFMLGTDKGASFFNEAVGFKTNYGIAQHAGQDTAFFYDSPLDDVFVGNRATATASRQQPDVQRRRARPLRRVRLRAGLRAGRGVQLRRRHRYRLRLRPGHQRRRRGLPPARLMHSPESHAYCR